MRRVTVQKPPIKPSARRVRDEYEDRAQPRAEVRKDIRRTWWPED
ncbi:hypothetical protein ACWCP6_35965 [Streptomyces sp. NPDC002004]